MAAIESAGRRKTYFFPATPSWAATGTNVPKSRPFPEENGEQKSTIESIRRKPDFLRPGKRTHSSIEKGIEIFPKRHTSLFWHRRDREDLVHIQHLKAGTATEPLFNTVSRYSHPSFLRLLCCYDYDQSAFLAWELVALSLVQVIGSKYSIREAELTSMVWPVIYEVLFLPLKYERRAHIHTPDHPGYLSRRYYLRDSSRVPGYLAFDILEGGAPQWSGDSTHISHLSLDLPIGMSNTTQLPLPIMS